MRAWYLSGSDRRLSHGDGREIAIGVTHAVDGPPVLCERGLHGSRRLIDTLEYAPGHIVWEVELGGEIVEGDDKAAATERTYLRGGIDIEGTLWEFARRVALSVGHMWAMPDIVQRYLETGDEGLRAAAMDAASVAARAIDVDVRPAAWAAWAAAWAARAAARAARAAARAARAAARAASAAANSARAAALAIARADQNELLTEMVEARLREAGNE